MEKRLGAVPFFIREKDRGASKYGGRFADHTRSDGEVSLTPAQRRRVVSNLSDADAYELALEHAERLAARAGLDESDIADIAQTSLQRILVASSRHRHTAEWNRRRINTAVRLAVARGLSDEKLLRAIDASARRALADLIDGEQRRRGRHLTREEVCDLADQLRDGWGYGLSRPSPGYYEQMRVVPLSMSESSVASEAESIPAADPTDDRTDYLEDELLSGFISQDEARQRVWNHFAVRFKVPMAPQGRVSTEEAEAARALIAERGGAASVAEEWLALTIADDDEDPIGDALFAPFPYATVPECRAVAHLLVERRRYADGLWASAMATAAVPAGSGRRAPVGDPVAVLDERGWRPLS